MNMKSKKKNRNKKKRGIRTKWTHKYVNKVIPDKRNKIRDKDLDKIEKNNF